MGAAALAAGAALVLSGCSAGQLSQTATQVAAVNGNAAQVGSIDLRNVRILAPSGEYTNKSGGSALLAFTAANVSGSETVKLEKITTSVASSVKFEPTDIKPLTALVAATPGEEDPLELKYLTVTLEGLKQDIPEGPTYDLTFEFSSGGKRTEVTLPVPIDSEGQPRFPGENQTEEHGESAAATRSEVNDPPPAGEEPANNPEVTTPAEGAN